MRDERPRIKMRFEVSIPDPEGGLPRKFSVGRDLKARWNDHDPDKVRLEILNEIKDYRGSFVGDLIATLNSLVKTENKPNEEEHIRTVDLARWGAAIIDTLVFFGIKDGLHKELLETQEVSEWDGSSKDISPVLPEELKNVDVDKLMLLLAPKMKHALYLISKDMKK
jgi:hypothetical protein